MSIYRPLLRHALPIVPALLLSLIGGFATPFAPVAQAAATAPSGVVELSPTPPNQTQAVAPNLMVTFDDSGSMVWTRMGDFPPFTTQTTASNGNTTSNYDWGGSSQPWRCANVIYPGASSGIGTHAMNGVYYNPNITYNPPMGEDGSVFPSADATLKSVPIDGIAVNRPFNKVTPQTAAYNNNPDLSGAASDAATTNLTGTGSSSWSCGGSKLNYTGYPGYYGATGESDGWGTYSGSNNSGTFTPVASPMNGSTVTLSDGSKVTYPKGGPYYWRFKQNLLGSITVNPKTGVPTAAGLKILYNATNWEAVPVLNVSTTMPDGTTVNQYQNFANWYAYYRTRNLMARTALSRVFANFGSPTSSNIRVAWQNLGNNNNLNSPNPQLPSSEIIAGLDDTTSYTQSDSKSTVTTYRNAFYNWIFNVVASNGTPTRDAIVRAGNFYMRGINAASPLTDPYWQTGSNGQSGQELACRQNFSLLVTDGYWNQDIGTQQASSFLQTSSSQILGDGSTTYTPTSSSSNGLTTMYNGAAQDASGTADNATMANIAFNYWAKNLRPDLATSYPNDKLTPYFPDLTVGVTGSATPSPPVDPTNPGATPEIYWNPVNDPATWPHMSDFYVTLGAGGLLSSLPKDSDCTQPGFDGIAGDNDYCALRTGKANAGGSTGWPVPNGNANNGNGEAQNIDDLWHAAVNSRGDFFTATDPQSLITDLSNILSNIIARVTAPTINAVNASVLTVGALSFNTGYSSVDWSGVLQAVTLNPDGTTAGLIWDAGVNLTNATTTPPSSRKILTGSMSNASTGVVAGISFEAASAFDTSESSGLQAPTATDTTNDTLANRVNYLRGVRTEETKGVMRIRSSLLGAIINSQAVYLSYPNSGYTSSWPAGSPEAQPAAQTYDNFVSTYANRQGMLYVGANDGMLHALNAPIPSCTATDPTTGACTTYSPGANAGNELWAYVPRAVYGNLGNLTSKNKFKFAPTVDGTPVVRDVFFNDNQWHTILVGGLRLGGRGVYALDVTNPSTVTEANASGKVLWEFDADAPAVAGVGNPAHLGYTYGQPNIGRLANGKWVVLVPGGYFPNCNPAILSDLPANCATAGGTPPSGYSSLFVLDAQTGQMIAELQTPTNISGVTSYGLSSPVLGDYNNDQIDDVAFAGDLAGNLWRFDLSNANPSNWTVSLAYQPATQGAQPITVMPRLFPDPATNRFIVVFGTGKYLGAIDNTTTTTQSVYGIRDLLNGSTPVTVTHSELQAQTLSESTVSTGTNAGATLRSLSNNTMSSTQDGWYFDLNLTTALGERVVVTPAAIFSSNTLIISTLIPGSTDPCNPSVEGAAMFVDAATGGAGSGVSSLGGGNVVGARVNNVRTSGTIPVTTVVGGGQTLLPGLTLTGKHSNAAQPFSGDSPIWRRRSWSELNNAQ